MKTKKAVWRLEVSRPLDTARLAMHDKLVERAVGVRAWASGGGLGARDMSFDLDSHDAACAAAIRAKKALGDFGVECETEVWEE